MLAQLFSDDIMFSTKPLSHHFEFCLTVLGNCFLLFDKNQQQQKFS